MVALVQVMPPIAVVVELAQWMFVMLVEELFSFIGRAGVVEDSKT